MMTDAEARQILGVTENTSWEEIVKVSPFSDSVSIPCASNKRLCFLCPNSKLMNPNTFLNFLRGMTSCSGGILKVAVSISNQRWSERNCLENETRSELKHYCLHHPGKPLLHHVVNNLIGYRVACVMSSYSTENLDRNKA